MFKDKQENCSANGTFTNFPKGNLKKSVYTIQPEQKLVQHVKQGYLELHYAPFPLG